MIDIFNFQHQDFIWPVVAGVILLFVFFVWKEWRSPLNNRFYLNAIVALIALISLAMLALKPRLLNSMQTNLGVLLTENFQEANLDSLKRAHKDLKVVPYIENQSIGKSLDSISSLFILGNGVRSFDFWQLKDMAAAYLGNTIPTGIIKLNYQKQETVGEKWVLRGDYNKPKKGHYLILADSGGKEIDSVRIDNSEQFDFVLSTILKVKGKYAYKLLEKDSLGTTISKENLPIKVLPKNKLRILMINGFPTFESKYLKNFLAESGNELKVRTQLTRGKFKFEYFNTKRSPFYSFSKKQLEPIDLIIVDANSYLNFSKESTQTIEDAMLEDGLGVLVLPDARFFRSSIKASNFEFLIQKSSKTNLSSWPKLSWDKFPYAFKRDYPIEKVHVSNEMILTAYKRKGKGRIGSTVIQNSYQLLLDGNTEAYTSFWSKAISDLSKRRKSTIEWSPSSDFAFEGEPFSFVIRTTEERPQVFGSNGRIPLMQSPDIRELWNGITYPRNMGWNSINSKNDSTSTLDYYVMDSTAWKSITSYNTMVANKRQFNSRTNSIEEKKVLVPIYQLWFLLLFILGMGYLWFAPKLFQN